MAKMAKRRTCRKCGRNFYAYTTIREDGGFCVTCDPRIRPEAKPTLDSVVRRDTLDREKGGTS